MIMRARAFLALLCAASLCLTTSASADDLADLKSRGVLRHLGIPYANFVTGSGDGLDVEMMQLFAAHLGVRYEYVKTDWKNVISDLIGRRVRPAGDDVELLEEVPVRGDVIANGLTVLPWRQAALDYSDPTFPSGVWLIARADASVRPVRATGDTGADIGAVRELLGGTDVLAMEGTCLDPKLYQLSKTGADVRLYTRSTNLNEMVPAILQGEAGTTLLDVPDALIALEKWPGEIKVIGPLTDLQLMGTGFRKDAPRLRAEFNAFFAELKRDGTYLRLVQKYYPTVLRYYEDFFAQQGAMPGQARPSREVVYREQ